MIVKNALTHNNERCDVHYMTLNTFEYIPSHEVEKVHAVCFYRGKILLVNLQEWNVWSIPGGTIEKGETPFQCLKREIIEETNFRIVDFFPLATQLILSPSNQTHFRLLYVCEVEPIGKFVSDPAGSVGKIELVDPKDYKNYIEPKPFKQIIIEDAIKLYENRENRK